jgi:hypothetical protein
MSAQDTVGAHKWEDPAPRWNIRLTVQAPSPPTPLPPCLRIPANCARPGALALAERALHAGNASIDVMQHSPSALIAAVEALSANTPVGRRPTGESLEPVAPSALHVEADDCRDISRDDSREGPPQPSPNVSPARTLSTGPEPGDVSERMLGLGPPTHAPTDFRNPAGYFGDSSAIRYISLAQPTERHPLIQGDNDVRS